MKKLLEIPFNHELIGQEGIVVKYRNGKEVTAIYVLKASYSTINYKDFSILSCPEDGGLIFHTLKGEYAEDIKSSNDLIMYQEVEVKEPRVIWVNIYPNNAIYAHNSKEDAFNDLMPSGKTVKFIEVIEEDE